MPANGRLRERNARAAAERLPRRKYFKKTLIPIPAGSDCDALSVMFVPYIYL